MQEALKRPIRAVIENKLGESCGHIIEKIESEGNFFAGYDVKNGIDLFRKLTFWDLERICDMMETGVVDSFTVVKSILQDSVSLAGMLITTECLVVKDKNYERKCLIYHLTRVNFSFVIEALPRQA